MQKFKLSALSFLTAFLLPALSHAQSISIVSGNGQLVCPDCPVNPQHYAPLVVQVNTATGAPAVGATVTWLEQQGGGNSPQTFTSLTNASGQATLNFQPLPFFSGPDAETTVTASALNTSIQFVVTTAQPVSYGSAGVIAQLVAAICPVNCTFVGPPALSGMDGQTATAPLIVYVSGLYGPIPGVQVSLKTTGGSTVGCATQPGQQPGTVLTGSNGFATCVPVFGGAIGSDYYIINVGDGFASFPQNTLKVTVGAPALIKIINGNNQSVKPGARTLSPMIAQVTDVSGNPVSGVPVTWSVAKGTATLSSAGTTTQSNGEVSAFVTATAGPVQVNVAVTANAAVSNSFTVNVVQVVTGVAIISGNNQQVKIGSPFAEPLVVQVNDNSTPLPGVTVNFKLTGGSAVLSAASAVTNAQGQAQITVAAGPAAGSVTITATASTVAPQTFTLTVLPLGPIITAVVNAAGFSQAPLAASPCSLVTVSGTGLADGIQGVLAPPIGPQFKVNGLTVTFNNTPAPILWVANVNGQESLAAQVPCEATVGTDVALVVSANGQPSTAFSVNITPYSPGIFQFQDSDGVNRAVVVRPDGSYASLNNPVRPGEIVRMFVTGLGQTTPALFTDEVDPLTTDASGNPVPQDLPVQAGIVVGVNNSGVLVTSARYAWFGVGVYEVDFQVPQDTALTNNAPFAIIVYQGTSALYGNGSVIAIQ